MLLLAFGSLSHYSAEFEKSKFTQLTYDMEVFVINILVTETSKRFDFSHYHIKTIIFQNLRFIVDLFNRLYD